ncbi:hypothetical protein [Corynebacterium urealyticum]|uniref:Uncharacterized protein n=1 Tax=Corynebacterium urealyticum (strain ATCC 43042 / DSM 7109) TaxID=504474 RepID=B1VGR0_CORU7|nr:hypothetical protein [Corynebacterium urealyticum]QQC41238.1 hypothetical protein I6H51_05675 [Corynebacterium urealyticum]CAQ05367.1 hypothetical protein cu1407 [Corynebacterium urealyticum DSM 7109]SNV88050.1 Uncharacterised protein [Corynebacterium urealyticum]
MTTTTHLERTPIPQARRAQRQCMPLPLAAPAPAPAPAAQIDRQEQDDAEQARLPEWADYLVILLLAVVAIQIAILVVFNVLRALWLW